MEWQKVNRAVKLNIKEIHFSERVALINIAILQPCNFKDLFIILNCANLVMSSILNHHLFVCFIFILKTLHLINFI